MERVGALTHLFVLIGAPWSTAHVGALPIICVYALILCLLTSHHLRDKISIEAIVVVIDLHLFVRSAFEAIPASFVLFHQNFRGFADADSSFLSNRLHFVGDHNILTKNVIVHNFGTDDATDEFTCVDADPHLQVFDERVAWIVALFIDNLTHVKTCLNDFVCFLGLYALVSSLFIDVAGVAHDNATIANCVDLVYVKLFTHKVKLAE